MNTKSVVQAYKLFIQQVEGIRNFKGSLPTFVKNVHKAGDSGLTMSCSSLLQLRFAL